MAAAALATGAGEARLEARPVAPHLLPPQPPRTPGAPGPKSQLHNLDVEPGSTRCGWLGAIISASPQQSHKQPARRDGMLFVPATYDHKQRSPLILMLHGACASGINCAHVFSWEELENKRAIMLLPDSRGRTWDIIRGSFGADVHFINRALKYVFENYNIDPWHVCCAGFSDGASYALSIGLPNGGKGDWADQIHGPFTHIMALSPGFMRPSSLSPIKPKVYISHGVGDQVLDINHCSRRIVSRLGSMGFKTPSPSQSGLLHYHEFTGGHCIPAKIATQALSWLVEEAPPK